MKKLEWYPEGPKRRPIVIQGDDEKNMLVTLAILQNFGREEEKLRDMHYIDPRDRKPLKLNINEISTE